MDIASLAIMIPTQTALDSPTICVLNDFYKTDAYIDTSWFKTHEPLKLLMAFVIHA